VHVLSFLDILPSQIRPLRTKGLEIQGISFPCVAAFFGTTTASSDSLLAVVYWKAKRY
jgi:hypothetical protein